MREGRTGQECQEHSCDSARQPDDNGPEEYTEVVSKKRKQAMRRREKRMTETEKDIKVRLGARGYREKTKGKEAALICAKVSRGAVSSTERKGWQEIEVTFDSGATDPVMPLRMCEGISIQPSPQSLRGAEYEVANGETIPNVGERRCEVMTAGSRIPKLMHFQICDVHKPVLSAARVADMGYRSVLDKDGGYLEDLHSGDWIPLERRGSLYVMRLWVREAGFTGQG